MSYCRFQNTANDLQECADFIDKNGTDDLSKDEKDAYLRMVETCRWIVEDFDNNEDEDNEDFNETE